MSDAEKKAAAAAAKAAAEVEADKAAAEAKAAKAAKKKEAASEETAPDLWVRTTKGTPTRFRAGEKFTRDWKAVDTSLLSKTQEQFIADDNKLEVVTEEPASVKAAREAAESE